MADQNFQLGQLFAAYWRAVERLENETKIASKTIEGRFPITQIYTQFWPPSGDSEAKLYEHIKRQLAKP